MKTCSFQGFASFSYFFSGQSIAIDLVFTVIITKRALVFTVSGEIDETIKKYPVAEIIISYFSRSGIESFQVFFGFKGKKKSQVIVRQLITFNDFFP